MTMSDFWTDLKQSITSVAGNWASYLALGSFVVYLLGYLVIRFHLTVWGVGTDLSVVDERYLFAGAKFLVYLFSTLPLLVLVALALSVLALVVTIVVLFLLRLLNLILPQKRRITIPTIAKVCEAFLSFWARPQQVLQRPSPRTNALVGIVISVVVVQFMMRQCFLYFEMLLAPSLPSPTPRWLTAILLDPSGYKQYFYFTLLVGLTLLTSAILFVVRIQNRDQPFSQFLILLLTVLVGIQILFLPVNYGTLVFDKSAPRLLALTADQPLTACGKCSQECQEAWLIWEGKDGMTYLVSKLTPNPGQRPIESRKMLTLSRAEVKRTEIVSYDSLLNRLFVDQRCTP